jgi:O-antigen ligase
MPALEFLELDQVARYGIAAAVAAVVLVVALGVSLHADLRLRRLYVPVVTLMIVTVPAVGVLLTGRDVTAVDFDEYVQIPTAVVWFLRLSSLAIVGLSLVRIGSQLIGKAAPTRAPVAVLIALLAFFVGNYLVNGLFGTVPSAPLQQSLYAALVLVAVFLSPHTDLASVLRVAKVGLALVMLASLALLALEPTLVRQTETAEIRLPGVGFRLFGLGANPNSIATLAIASLLLSLYQPFRSKLLEAVTLAAALAVLLLAQSQTSWLAAMIAVPALLIGRARIRLMHRRTLVALGSLFALAAVATLAAFSFTTHGVALTDFVTGDRYRELTTLTGRSSLWDAAILEWRENPLFGYGPAMWGEAYRARLGLPFAFNAHNQYLQSLSTAGLVGLATLLPYLLLLGLFSFTAPRPQRGLAIALFLQILVRSFTEVPLDLGTPFANEFFPHFLLFTVIAFARRSATVEAPAPARVRAPTPPRPASTAPG